ncbi:MAG: electron transfer flavoprotein subunit alpha/FixB family protein, partial [Acidimicrobiales bacterium]
MTLSTLWVLVEPTEDSFTSTSLELLSHARTLSDNVAAITWGNGASFAGVAGDYGAKTLYDVGDLAGALPGVPVASAIQELVTREGAPDAILIPTSYDGRDVAGRLSARLDRPVLTNVTGLRDEGGLVTEHPVFGGSLTVNAKFT